MSGMRLHWQEVLALAAVLGAVVTLPAAGENAAIGETANALMALGVLLIGIAGGAFGYSRAVSAVLLFIAAHGAAWMLISGVAGGEGTARLPYFLALFAAWLLAWRLVSLLSAMPAARRRKARGNRAGAPFPPRPRRRR